MKRARTIVSAVLVSSILFGCSLLKKKVGDDAGSDPGGEDAATVIVTGTGAVNEKNVLRYKNEEKIADEPAVIAKDGTHVRTFANGGEIVATIGKGTNVVKIAKYFASGVLITYNDPTGGGKMIGWVAPSAFEAGEAPPADTGGTAPKPMIVAPKPLDGGVAKADAGATVADAGVASADAGAPSRATLLMPPVAGKCLSGFALLDGFCRRPCNTDPDCPRTTFCVTRSGKKYCSATK